MQQQGPQAAPAQVQARSSHPLGMATQWHSLCWVCGEERAQHRAEKHLSVQVGVGAAAYLSSSCQPSRALAALLEFV